MSHEEAREIVIDEATRHGRDREISFVAAYTPLGPNEVMTESGMVGK